MVVANWPIRARDLPLLCYKLSCKQPFLPHFEFLLEYHYDVKFQETTSIQPWLIQCLKIKFLERFLQLLELKCMAVEKKKTALSSRGVEIQNWTMPWHAWAKNRLDCSFSFCLHFYSVAVISGGLFRLRSINRLTEASKKRAIIVIWKNKSNNKSTILNTVVLSTIFTSTYNSYKWLKYYFNRQTTSFLYQS